MRRNIVFVSLIASFLISFQIASADDATLQSQQPDQSNSNSLNLTFIQSADSAVLKALPKKPGYYTLTLYKTSPYITYLSPRPKKITGLAPFENFVKAWGVGNNNFETSNPNAVLCSAEIDGLINQNQKTYLMSLSSPAYSKTRSIARYVVVPLSREGFILKQINFKHINLIFSH